MGTSALRTRVTAVLAVIASAVMALAMFAGVARADGDTCSVTVTNANVGQTYRIYKIFDVTTTDSNFDANTGYSYTIPATTDDSRVALVNAVKNNAALSGLFSSLNDPEYYQVVSGVLTSDNVKSELVGVIKTLIEQGDVFTLAGEKTADGSTVTFEGLEPGYYFISTTTGTLCTIDTTTGNAEVKDKNTVPTLTKQVRFVKSAIDEDAFAEETTFADTTTAGFGDTVEYQVKVTLPEGSTDIELHDVLPAGITFDAATIKVTSSDGTVTLGLADDYTVATGSGESFVLKLTADGLAEVNGTADANGGFVVTYTGTLNTSATVGTAGNKNAAYVVFGTNATKTQTATATVYTYSLTVNKVDGSDNPLEGAVFALSTQNSADSNIHFGEKTADETPTYPVTAGSDTYKITTDASGAFVITGLKPGTYYLAELQSPKGYNLLASSEVINLDSTNFTTVQKVINEKGTILPGTGGIGTTIFYVVGGVLVVGAVVALVAKKKMSANK